MLNEANFNELEDAFSNESPLIAVYDTETDGLDNLHSKPFLIGVGLKNSLFIFEPTVSLVHRFLQASKSADYLLAHNAKFDYHMLLNMGCTVPDDCRLGDTLAMARITEYADSEDGISLESLGKRYVDEESKFASAIIKKLKNEINKRRLIEAKTALKKLLPKNIKLSDVVEGSKKKVYGVNTELDPWINKFDTLYEEATYKSVYQEYPELMISYLADDLVVTLLYAKKAFPVLACVDPDFKVWNQENELIRVVADIERNGMAVSVDYLLESRKKVLQYRELVYNQLWEKTGIVFTAGQHQVIKDYFLEKFGISMESSDKASLEQLSLSLNGEGQEIASMILELRTLDKWLSTYIEGMLNRVSLDDDFIPRIYPEINNSGAVTGRVSSDMQQQPSEPLLTKDGEELFHPRRVFVADEGSNIFYFDFSQMELRLQAYYTLLVSDGDENLCRAFMPFKFTSYLTGETFDFQKHDPNSDEWVDENGNLWKPVDLHNITTLKAFPNLTVDHPDFKHYRRLGKVGNFLKNYGGGLQAIKDKLHVDDEIANAINRGYYEAFPKILDYQRWVESQLSKYGYVENIFGRRYYLRSSNLFYRAYNYLIQGGCADLMKQKEIRVYNFLKEHKLKTKVLLPVHDELQLSIPFDEHWIVPKIKGIMDDNKDYIASVPMICDIEMTSSTWADKKDYEIEGL